MSRESTIRQPRSQSKGALRIGETGGRNIWMRAWWNLDREVVFNGTEVFREMVERGAKDKATELVRQGDSGRELAGRVELVLSGFEACIW